jgi:MFS transporter, PPP family, 3-phenylpropionic acid transporter
MSSFFPSAFYFAFFAGMAFLMPFLALYYQDVGFSGTQIGLLTGVAPLVTLAGAPFWTGIADSTRRHKAVMVFAMLTVIGAMLLMPRFSAFAVLFGLVVVFAFFGAPIASLADSATMNMLGENRQNYGKIRLWGAVGWGLVAPVAGMVVERLGLAWPFYGYAIGMGFALLAALAFHFPAGQVVVQFKAGMRSLLTSRRWMSFLLMVLLCGIGMATVNSYLFIHMESLGMSKTLMGLALTVSTFSEIPVMFFAGRFLKRFNPRDLLLLALLVVGARLLLYAISGQGWQILLIQLVHGFTFPIIWVAGVSYADQVAPPGLSASAQGMFGSTLMGVGAALGGLLGGILLQGFGSVGMYSAVGTGLTIVGFFMLLTRLLPGKRQTE